MKRWLFSLFIMFAVLPARAQRDVNVTVRPAKEAGAVKMMNAANNFAWAPADKENGVPYAKELACPFSRIHDAERVPHGSGIVDVNAVFPDFDKDPSKPENYNFHHSDRYMKTVVATGTKILYRLGQSAESGPVTIGPVPPKDFKKWAVICEHIIRHYNEGWADGYHYGIEYWEIWNEPNIALFWAGTPEQYYELYAVSSKHLKKCFPSLKFGGPAIACGDKSNEWTDDFLRYIKARKAPLDFFTYHQYTVDPGLLVSITRTLRELLDSHGYKGMEMQLGEWNYVTGWSSAKVAYSNDIRRTSLGGAFAAAVMCTLQKESVDKLFFYDLREYTRYNNAYDRYDGVPWPAFYALYSWAQLRKLGTAVEVEASADDFYACAAKGPDGRGGVLIARYGTDLNDVLPRNVKLRVEGSDLKNAVCFMTDKNFLFSGLPVGAENGVLSFKMQPNSFVWITY